MEKSLLAPIRFLFVLLILIVAPLSSWAASKDEAFDPFEASIEENISTPAVNPKQSAAVVSAMAQLERAFKTAGYATAKVRNGEVIMVTIPCSKLFAPNASKLKADAPKQLLPLVPYVKRFDKYKVVLAVHSDNTGDEQYSDRLTADRASAVDDYFAHEASLPDEAGIIPYGLGADEPVAPNTGIKNREANRRLGVYFIPTAEYIEKIRSRK